MKDKLTKKRLKIDYLLIIEVCGLTSKFLKFQREKKSHISVNRLALAFLRVSKVDIESVYYECQKHGYQTYDDYLNECIRLAKDHSWIAED